MIVRKPIGPLRIENTLYRLSVGKPLPEEVIKFYTDNGQLENMIRQGTIEGEIKTGKSGKGKFEKQGTKDIGDEPVRESEKGQSEDPE